MAQNQESIWGTVNTALEIAINVFYLVGEKGAGLQVPAGYAGNPKLQKFLEMGDRDGEYLYFSETAQGYEEVKETLCEEYAPALAPDTPSADAQQASDALSDWQCGDDEPLSEPEAELEYELEGFEP